MHLPAAHLFPRGLRHRLPRAACRCERSIREETSLLEVRRFALPSERQAVAANWPKRTHLAHPLTRVVANSAHVRVAEVALHVPWHHGVCLPAAAARHRRGRAKLRDTREDVAGGACLARVRPALAGVKAAHAQVKLRAAARASFAKAAGAAEVVLDRRVDERTA
eukprot:356902-Chlamydomonas_euryale.AAC.1